jgi:MFS family permease
VQTLAQVGEIAALMLFPFMLGRFGFKGVLALGLVAIVARNGAFASESIPLVVGLGLPLSGIGYACFTVVASMYVDRIAPAHLRASAQAVVIFISHGIGTLAGMWLAGTVVEQHASGEAVAWGPVWLVPTVIASVLTIAFVALFRAEAHPHRVSR